MDILKNNIEKLCSFYVSDWHLVTMLLPYINKQINEKANIITVLENNIEENVKTLVSKLNLKNREEILNLNWKENKISKYSEIKEIMKKLKRENIENIIFINGSKNFVDIVNKNINKYLENIEKQLKKHKNIEEKIKDMKIKIVDCYEVGDFNLNIQEILQNHDRILNTSGEKEINDVFEGYA